MPMTGMTYEEALARATRDRRTLGAEFLRNARRGPRTLAVVDARGSMSRLKLAGAALALIPLLELAKDEPNVGIMLPPGRGGTLANLAVALAGRTAVNLNHTSGEAQVARMCRLAAVRTIISSREYLSRIGNPALPGRVLHAEDLLAQLSESRSRVLRQMARVMAVSPHRIDPSRPEQVAAIVFSSGSESEPKGIQLTHQQILANSDAIVPHLDLQRGKEILASPLPLFHSFGLVPGMWLCLAYGFTIAGQADPRDGPGLGRLIERTKATVMVSTPTFARGYMRRIKPEQMSSMKLAVVGAEHCPTELRRAFREQYGFPLLEGYGCTELTPVVSVNKVDQSREGSVGPPLPGVEVFTMDPDTREILPRGEEGVLVVRSPARMLGYLDRPDLTERVFVHGGYDTGDMGHVDEDGFIHITGRLARFAKIGGEMVPLDLVEERLQNFVDEGCGMGSIESGAPSGTVEGQARDGQAAAGASPASETADDATSGGPSDAATVPGSLSADGSAPTAPRLGSSNDRPRGELAVAAVKDGRKGERLIVLHTGIPCAPEELLAGLDDLPSLYKPRPRDVHQVDELPMLGTGKRDYGRLQKLAQEVAASQPSGVGSAVRRLVGKMRRSEPTEGDPQAEHRQGE